MAPRTEAATARRTRPARRAGLEDEALDPAAEQVGELPVAEEGDFGQSFGMEVRSCTVLTAARGPVVAPRLLVALGAGEEEHR